jgi:hypothetical protein
VENQVAKFSEAAPSLDTNYLLTQARRKSILKPVMTGLSTPMNSALNIDQNVNDESTLTFHHSSADTKENDM